MTKIFLDTNVWLRFFLHDNDQFASVEKLITAIEEGKFLPYTSSIVFLELVFVLGKTYGLPKEKVANYLEAIRETRNLTLIEKTNTKKALGLFAKHSVKFSDCLIASQISTNMVLVTFDQEFLKMKSIKSKAPEEII